MKETPAQLAARLGAAYAPAVVGARPLAADEPCPTLFRYPGPIALHEALARGLPPLAPPGSPVIWLHEDPRAPAARAVALFGSLALLEPLRLSPAVLGDAWAAAAEQPIDPDTVIWVPPSRVVAGGAPWDAIGTQAGARAWLGPSWEGERDRVLDALGAYLEEIAELARAGVPPPRGAWCEVPAEERARILAEHAVSGRFSGRG